MKGNKHPKYEFLQPYKRMEKQNDKGDILEYDAVNRNWLNKKSGYRCSGGMIEEMKYNKIIAEKS